MPVVKVVIMTMVMAMVVRMAIVTAMAVGVVMGVVMAVAIEMAIWEDRYLLAARMKSSNSPWGMFVSPVYMKPTRASSWI